MSEPEAIGEAVTGAALSRAVEPKAGEVGADGHTREAACLNCNAPLEGHFCSNCGQRAHVHRTLGAWWQDFRHSVLHVDGKFWLTLGMLIWSPGVLTRRYVRGQRARFVSPLALFLFTVFLMFAIFSIIGGPFDTGPAADRARLDVQQQVENLRAQSTKLGQRRTELTASGRSTAAIDAQIAQVDRELRAAEALRPIVLVPSQAPEGSVRTIELDRDTIATGWPWLDSAIAKTRKNPELLAYKVQANAYKFSWALIPLSLPFVWLLFLNRRRYRREYSGYDHLVFVTFSTAFMSMLLVAFALLSRLGTDTIAILALLIVPPVHMYRQLRGAYELSRFSAAWRAAALVVFALLTLLLFAALLLALGTFG